MYLDYAYDKYIDLMNQMETLEEKIEEEPNNFELQEKLATVSNELARVCDGCGTFHTKNL